MSDTVTVDDPLTRTCNGCGALPGQPCLAPTGRVAAKTHQHRLTGNRRSPAAMEANRVRNRDRYRAAH